MELWFACKSLVSSLCVEARLLTQIFDTNSQLCPEECSTSASGQRCGGTKPYGRLRKSDIVELHWRVAQYNPWLQRHVEWWYFSPWSVYPEGYEPTVMKPLCLLRVDSASKRNDLANKTNLKVKACFVWEVFTTAACLLLDVVSYQFNSPLPRQLATPYPCVCVFVVCAVHSRLVQMQLEVRLALTFRRKNRVNS